MRHNGKNQMFPDKRQRFSIRKFKTGVASVVFVALFLGNMATVAAEQVPTNTDSSAKEVVESDVALPTDETLDKVPTTDEEVAPIEEGVDASLAPLESAEAPQEFRAAVGTERSAATNTKGVVVKPGQGITTISEIPTDGFTTTEPEVKSMNPKFTGTVNHNSKNYTFAVIKTDKLNDRTTGPLYVDKSGEVVTSSSGGAALIHQMAFSTDRDGTGNVYIDMYGGDGKLLMTDTLVPGLHVNELKYVSKGRWLWSRDTTYTIQHREVITNNGNLPIASVSTSDATDGWFDELYTNYEKALGYTNGRYMGYGWFVPRLIDKKTEYVVKDSNKVLATVIQTEMSGYKFTTAAPETITADGVTYKLIKDSGTNTSGFINPLVSKGDALAVGTDKGYFIRYLMNDDNGKAIDWELLDSDNNVAKDINGKPAKGVLRDGQTANVTVDVASTNTRTTFYINNPYFPGGRTVYYYEVVPTSEVPKGSVTVKHITTTGEVLKEETSVKTNEPVGTPYETKPEDKIVTDNGRTFKYKEVDKTSAQPKGEVKEGTQKVTFVYEEVKGNVTVEHVTTDGKVLKAETPVFSENQSTGTAYETKNETELKDEAGNVYVFKEHKADSAPVSGKVTETAQKVVYVYELKPVTPTPSPTPDAPKGNVTVEHVTTTGEVLKKENSVKTNEPVGTPYETQPEDKIVTDNGRTFVYKGLNEDSADPTGEVKEGTQKVTFVYEEIKGNVTVEHVTTDGKVLKAETPVFSENQSTGTAYETKNETELKDEAGNVYVFKEHKADSAPVSGKVTETAQKVVYVYELKPVTPTPSPTPDAPKGNVTVEHVTTTGEVLKKETPVKTDEPVGTPYETKPEDKIVTDNGRTFKYKEVDKTSAQPTGEVKEGTQKVTFVYEEVKGNVTVEHVTTDGKVLKAETPVFSENQSTGTAYETKNETELKDEAGNVYVFKEHKADSAPVSGKVTETAQKVVYVYELKPVTPTPSPTPDAPKGNVTVEHVTTTGEVLKKETPVKTDEPVGTPYETKPEDKIVTDNGRTFKYKEVDKTSAQPTGEVKEGTQKVTFVYEEIKGNVTVEHVTTDGKVLKAETPVFSENQSTGTAYETKNETELKDEAGNVYVFKEHKADSAPVSGKVTETAQKVVYIYELKPVTPTPSPTPDAPKGNVTVEHITTTGEVLKKETPVKTDEPVGTPYETQPEDKIVTDNGRTFVYKGLKEDSADPKGEVKEGTQKVTFVYEEVKGNVTVEHVTTDGKVLKAETPVFSENQSTGTAYETKNETELKDEAGNVYVFKEHKADSAPVSGKVTETAQKVVYVYELKPVTPTPSPTPDTPKGNVTVEHITTTGEVLKKETPVKTDEPVGTPYETKPEDKIVTDNGRTFKYKEVDKTSAQPKGEVKEDTQKVTFVYEEIKGNVTVEHVTTDGKVLKAETPVFSENQSTGTAYETKNETELKDEAGNVYVFKEHKADSAPVSGKVTETAQKVVYVYELKPVTPTPTPEVSKPKSTTPATPTQDSSIPTSVVSTNKAQLPNTGEDNSVAFATLGTAMLVATFALNGKRRQDEN